MGYVEVLFRFPVADVDTSCLLKSLIELNDLADIGFDRMEVDYDYGYVLGIAHSDDCGRI